MQASINIGNESFIYRLKVGDTRGCRQVLILVMRVSYIVLNWEDSRRCRQVLILVMRVSYIVFQWGILGGAGKY